MYEHEFQVAWGEVDPNRHLSNAGYLNYASQTRFLYLASQGFPPEAFARHGIGPAILKDEITYRRELAHLDVFKVQMLLAGQNAARTRSMFVNRFVRGDELCAEVRTMFVWFDLTARKTVAPPPELAAAMDALARTDDYAEL